MARVVRKNRRLAAANTKWQVFFDHLTDGRGNEVADYLILEGITSPPDHITGVCILPVVEGRFLLIKSYRHALATELWETPRGFMDAGETPPEAALRELAEETGLSCAPADLIPLGYFAPEASTIAARGGMFVALNCTGTLRPAEDEIGLGELHLFGRDELADVVARGEIEDVGTLITYYRYLAWMARQGGERG